MWFIFIDLIFLDLFGTFSNLTNAPQTEKSNKQKNKPIGIILNNRAHLGILFLVCLLWCSFFTFLFTD